MSSFGVHVWVKTCKTFPCNWLCDVIFEKPKRTISLGTRVSLFQSWHSLIISLGGKKANWKAKAEHLFELYFITISFTNCGICCCCFHIYNNCKFESQTFLREEMVLKWTNLITDHFVLPKNTWRIANKAAPKTLTYQFQILNQKYNFIWHEWQTLLLLVFVVSQLVLVLRTSLFKKLVQVPKWGCLCKLQDNILKSKCSLFVGTENLLNPFYDGFNHNRCCLQTFQKS